MRPPRNKGAISAADNTVALLASSILKPLESDNAMSRSFMNALRLLVLCCVGFCAKAQEPVALKLTATIPLARVTGRFDHFSIDAEAHRLFAAALGNNTVEILDVAAAKPMKSIGGLHTPQGVIYLPGRKQIGVANGGSGTFSLFDELSFAMALLHN